MKNVHGYAMVDDTAQVYDDARVYGYALVFDHAQIAGNAQVYDHAIVADNARVSNDAIVADDAIVYGNAIISGYARIIAGHITGGTWTSQPLVIYGSRHMLTNSKPGYIRIGCIELSFSEWLKEWDNIGNAHDYNEEHRLEYLKHIMHIIEHGR